MTPWFLLTYCSLVKKQHRLRYTCNYENKVDGRVRQKLNDVVGLMKSAIPCGGMHNSGTALGLLFWRAASKSGNVVANSSDSTMLGGECTILKQPSGSALFAFLSASFWETLCNKANLIK